MKIKLSKLAVIKSPSQFFAAEKIILCDVVEVPANPAMAAHPNAFTYNQKLYMFGAFIGSPQNLFKVACRGISAVPILGCESWLRWDGDLLAALKGQKIYDLSAFSYRNNSELRFKPEPQLLAARYIDPYVKNTVTANPTINENPKKNR